MRTLLCSQDVWDVVVHGYTKPANHATKKALTNAQKDHVRGNMKKDEKPLYLIQNDLDESIFSKISTVRFSKTTWDILQTN